VSYVDDAFFYGNKSFEVTDDPDSGIHIHSSKSGWVKRDGRWLKPLKFLGLEFDGRMFSASTRKGSRLVYTSSVKTALKQIDEKLALLSSTGLSENVKTEYTWDAVFKSKYIGWVQARLYEGNWNPEVVQDFELKFGNGSWGTLKGREFHAKFTLSNTSSYAAKSLVNLMRYSKGQRYLRRSEALRVSIGKKRYVKKSV
jgi:hypothetical protein